MKIIERKIHVMYSILRLDIEMYSHQQQTTDDFRYTKSLSKNVIKGGSSFGNRVGIT